MTVRVINDDRSLFRLGLLAEAMDRRAQDAYACAQGQIAARNGNAAMTLVQEYLACRGVAERARRVIAERTNGEGQS